MACDTDRCNRGTIASIRRRYLSVLDPVSTHGMRRARRDLFV
jgi:hypothetical protein